ncbi:MAG: cell division ATP-binding protein FtsE [Candidatus Parcubacteria bacterium]|nr:cell division ATP-binding protein FtsE [Candidatus Parcubacteria bacterium]
MIKFQNTTKIYNSGSGVIAAVDDISFEVQKGEFVCLVGKSGAGKTTLFKLLLAEEKPSKGHIFFYGKDIDTISSGDIPALRRKIGSVFQDYKLLPVKTLFENIAYIMEVTGAEDAQIKHDVTEVLDIVGLSERQNNFPEELSGGEKQRAAIARAMIHRPEVILADEPTGNLDPYNTQDIINLLLRINEFGTTVILATHNKDVVDKMEKRVITLEAGKLIRDEEGGRFVI